VAASGPSGSVEQRVTEPVEVVTSVERSEVLMLQPELGQAEGG
jgi:hypothetical protein